MLKTILGIIAAVGIVLVIATFSYFVFVGFAWLIQWLINQVFNTHFNLNIWWAGALLFVVSFIIRNK